MKKGNAALSLVYFFIGLFFCSSVYILMSDGYRDVIDDGVADLSDPDDIAAVESFENAWWALPKIIIFILSVGLLYFAFKPSNPGY